MCGIVGISGIENAAARALRTCRWSITTWRTSWPP